MRRIADWQSIQRLEKSDRNIASALANHDFAGSLTLYSERAGGLSAVEDRVLVGLQAGISIQVGQSSQLESELIQRARRTKGHQANCVESLLASAAKKDGSRPSETAIAFLVSIDGDDIGISEDAKRDLKTLKSIATDQPPNANELDSILRASSPWTSKLLSRNNKPIWSQLDQTTVQQAVAAEITGDAVGELQALQQIYSPPIEGWTDLDFRCELRRAYLLYQNGAADAAKLVLWAVTSNTCRIAHWERAIVWYEKLSIVALNTLNHRVTVIASIKCAKAFERVFGSKSIEGHLMLARACHEALKYGRPKLARRILRSLISKAGEQFWLTYIGVEITCLDVMIAMGSGESSDQAANAAATYISGRLARRATFFPTRILALLDLKSPSLDHNNIKLIASHCVNALCDERAAPEDKGFLTVFENHVATATAFLDAQQTEVQALSNSALEDVTSTSEQVGQGWRILRQIRGLWQRLWESLSAKLKGFN